MVSYQKENYSLKKCQGVDFSSGPLHQMLKQDKHLLQVAVCLSTFKIHIYIVTV